MGEQQHTPNPYMRDGSLVYALNASGVNRFSACVQRGQDDEGNTISEAEAEATAQLFEAAPDLLEACEAMAAWDAAENNAPPYDSDGGASFRERTELCTRAFELAHTAIAKARGEQAEAQKRGG